MANLQISGEHILKYPDIAAFLHEHNIAIRDVRYVEVEQKRRVPGSFQEHGTARNEIEATVILHDDARWPIPLERLTYNG